MWIITNTTIVLAITFTMGLALPFAMCFRERWVSKHTIIDGRQHEFYGSPLFLFLRTVLLLLFGPMLIALAFSIMFWVLPSGDGGDINVLGFALVPTLTLIAYGIFMAWLALRMKKWIVRHTRIIIKKEV